MKVCHTLSHNRDSKSGRRSADQSIRNCGPQCSFRKHKDQKRTPHTRSQGSGTASAASVLLGVGGLQQFTAVLEIDLGSPAER